MYAMQYNSNSFKIGHFAKDIINLLIWEIFRRKIRIVRMKIFGKIFPPEINSGGWFCWRLVSINGGFVYKYCIFIEFVHQIFILCSHCKE